MVAEVIVDIAHSEVDKVFDYKFDDGEVSLGDRVEIPFGKMRTEGFVINVKQSSEFGDDKLKKVIRVLDDFPVLTEETLALARFVKERYHTPFALALRLFIPSELRGGRVKAKTVYYAELSDELSPFEMVASLRKGSSAQANLIGYLNEVKRAKRSEINEKFGSGAVNKLVERGYVKITCERADRVPYREMQSFSKTVELSEEQKNAISGIEKTDKTVSLLFGVTGSGKTEVYLKMIDAALKRGKTAIMLVPEIALTPQMLKQLRARFADSVSILHSGLSVGERYDEWVRLRNGEAKIAIGARSAIFAPLENVGIIIIDEEHDGSYDAENAPRYRTIEVAKKRAELSGCKIILGSATPSIETFDKARTGEYNLVEMKKRINGKNLPDFDVVDMRREIRNGNNGIFSADLREELKNCVAEGNQAIIFFNRRGYSRQVICRDCGYVPKCENCDISLNYHKAGNLLKCHYCNATYKMITACPECGSVNLGYDGAGTQKIVDEIRKIIPAARILRMDNDTTRTKEGHYGILKEFSDKKADILVGTQMVAKGHDFPSVTLVGIIDADMSLYFSDYRSNERTYQLITQVAGRSGRADKKGKVVLQTYNPDNPTLKYSVTYDYEGFFERERAMRKTTGFPPFALIIRIMIESEEDEAALSTLKTIFEKVKKIYDNNRENFLFFNKMRSPVKRLNGKFRYQILARLSGDYAKVREELYEAEKVERSPKTLVYVEENPSNLF